MNKNNPFLIQKFNHRSEQILKTIKEVGKILNMNFASKISFFCFFLINRAKVRSYRNFLKMTQNLQK